VTSWRSQANPSKYPGVFCLQQNRTQLNIYTSESENRNRKDMWGWSEELPFKHFELFAIQRMTDGDGVGIKSDEEPAPQPREAREGPGCWPWPWPGKQHLLPLLSCGGAQGADAGLHIQGCGGAGGLGIRRWHDSNEGTSLRLRGHGCSDPSRSVAAWVSVRRRNLAWCDATPGGVDIRSNR
jgi:hypothetical protein